CPAQVIRPLPIAVSASSSRTARAATPRRRIYLPARREQSPGTCACAPTSAKPISEPCFTSSTPRRVAQSDCLRNNEQQPKESYATEVHSARDRSAECCRQWVPTRDTCTVRP